MTQQIANKFLNFKLNFPFFVNINNFKKVKYKNQGYSR